MKRTIKIDSERWAYGEKSNGELLDREGNYCVLGFIGQQAFGLKDSELKHRGAIASVLEAKPVLAQQFLKLPIDNYDWEVAMYRLNDARTLPLTERKKSLREKAKEAGFKLIFSRS